MDTQLPKTGSRGVVSRRRRKTQEALLEAAKVVFHEVGFQAASIEEICERAGFTRGAFYSNFASKDDLVLEIFSREFTKAHQTMAKVVEEELTQNYDVPLQIETTIRRIIQEIIKVLLDEHDLYRVKLEFRLHALRTPEVAAAYQLNMRQFINVLASYLESALAKVGYRWLLPADEVAVICVSIEGFFADDEVFSQAQNTQEVGNTNHYLNRYSEVLATLLSKIIVPRDPAH